MFLLNNTINGIIKNNLFFVISACVFCTTIYGSYYKLGVIFQMLRIVTVMLSYVYGQF